MAFSKERIIDNNVFASLSKTLNIDAHLAAYLRQVTFKDNDEKFAEDEEYGLVRSLIPEPVSNIKDEKPEKNDYRICVKIDERVGHLRILRLQLEEKWADPNHKIRRLALGEKRYHDDEKTIFLVGATGAGKSTFVDALINYVLKVKWTDGHRLRLVNITDDEMRHKDDQTKSQTRWITVYQIPNTDDTMLPYTLNIVDTPGFGDTEGVERDKELVEQMRQFFADPSEHGIDSVDAIGFFVQAPSSRLTPTQRYVFGAMLSIFGKDVAENIFAIITFADGRKPPCIQALDADEIPYKKYFKFNNSALYAPNKFSDGDDDEYQFNKMFWDLGQKNLMSFFEHLIDVPPKSLTLTSQVLRKRKELTNSIQHLKSKIEEGCQKMVRLEAEKEIMTKHKKDIEDNQNFTYTVDEEKMVKHDVPSGRYVTNCSICHTTCHENCAYKNDEDKHKCIAMDDSGKCKRCQSNCKWDLHYNQAFYFVMEVHTVTKTYFEMKARYDKAQHEKLMRSSVIEMLFNEYKQVESELAATIRKARMCLEELRHTALKPDPLSDERYIDMLIHDEKAGLKKGWERRVKMLENIRHYASLMTMVKTTLKPESYLKK